MSKEITIKNKIWKGTVTIYDRLVLSQVELVEEALLDNPPFTQREVTNEKGEKEIKISRRYTHLDKPKIPALIACVEKWEIENFPDKPTIETFPLTPRAATSELIQQIFDEIKLIYNGEIELPN